MHPNSNPIPQICKKKYNRSKKLITNSPIRSSTAKASNKLEEMEVFCVYMVSNRPHILHIWEMVILYWRLGCFIWT